MTRGLLLLALPLLAGCYECTQENCPDGCCSADRVCIVAPKTDQACGLGGLLCEDCTERNRTCVNSVCTARCNPGNCASGCCRGDSCVAPASQSLTSCGTAAAVCAACPGGSACVSGKCCAGNGGTCTSSDGCCGGLNCVKNPPLAATGTCR